MAIVKTRYKLDDTDIAAHISDLVDLTETFTVKHGETELRIIEHDDAKQDQYDYAMGELGYAPDGTTPNFPAEILHMGGFTTANQPTADNTGDQYFDLTAVRPTYWNGSAYKTLADEDDIGANNELSEILANGNTTGANDIIIDTSQVVTLTDHTDFGALYTNADGDIISDSNVLINGGTYTIDVSGGVRVDGKLTVTGLIDPTGLVLDEQSSNPATPTAGHGILWVKDDAPNKLMFTDDAGTEFTVATLADIQGQDTLAEILSNGNTTGGTDLEISNGDTVVNESGSTSAIFQFDVDNTAAYVIDIEANSLTTGRIMSLTSASATTNTRNLIHLASSNAAATGTTVLNVSQGSTGLAIKSTGDVFVTGNIEVDQDTSDVAVSAADFDYTNSNSSNSFLSVHSVDNNVEYDGTGDLSTTGGIGGLVAYAADMIHSGASTISEITAFGCAVGAGPAGTITEGYFLNGSFNAVGGGTFTTGAALKLRNNAGTVVNNYLISTDSSSDWVVSNNYPVDQDGSTRYIPTGDDNIIEQVTAVAEMSRITSDGATAVIPSGTAATWPGFTTSDQDTAGKIDTNTGSNVIDIDNVVDSTNGDLYEVTFISSCAYSNGNDLQFEVVYNNGVSDTSVDIAGFHRGDGALKYSPVVLKGTFRGPTSLTGTGSIFVTYTGASGGTFRVRETRLLVKRISA